MKELETIENKIKGYGFDSLCLRYNIARDAQVELQVKNGTHDRGTAEKLANRDKLKFYEILDDLIGGHD